jgi:hypothetical protein
MTHSGRKGTMPNPQSEKNCGTCKWAVNQEKGYCDCAYPLPFSVTAPGQGWIAGALWMSDQEGASCQCHSPKEKEKK